MRIDIILDALEYGAGTRDERLEWLVDHWDRAPNSRRSLADRLADVTCPLVGHTIKTAVQRGEFGDERAVLHRLRAAVLTASYAAYRFALFGGVAFADRAEEVASQWAPSPYRAARFTLRASPANH